MKKLIGNTPMIEITYTYKGKKRKIYAKLEYYNLTGSIKDRMVYHILSKNIENGNILPGTSLIEATSGNTGISLAAIGAYFHHPVYIFMPDFVSVERRKLIESYGANITLVTKEEGGYKACIEKADALAKKIGGYRLNQFSNPLNVSTHYITTGTEIIKQVGKIDGFVSGIGTGGTLMGIGLKLKDIFDQVTIGAIEPATMTLLSSKPVLKEHKIDGIADGFLPAIVDRNLIDKVYLIDDEDAINMCKKLSRKLGIGVGFSSGANLLGSILLEEEIGGNIVTVFPDDSKKYLSVHASDPINLDSSFLSNEIELIDYKIM